MVTAFALLTVDRDRVHPLAEELADMPGIAEVYSVAGRFDLVVIIRAGNNEQLEEIVTDQLLQKNGIHKSETLIAFRAYSRHDLESMFTIGMDD